MNVLDKYMDLINEDKALYVDVIESLRRNICTPVFDNGTTLILEHSSDWPFYFVVTRDTKDALSCLREKDYPCLLVRDAEILEYYRKKGYGVSSCYQVYYDGEKLPLSGTLEMKELDMSYIPVIAANYNMYSEEETIDTIKRHELFGGFAGDTLIGFIGIHGEGSMGMLHIFDEYRKKGYGYEMEKFLINYQLDRGAIPYGQVVDDNEKSLFLQKKMGMKVSRRKFYWTWKEDQNEQNEED
ncbi:MAG: GNAT family N-acetyltransferase [Clostridia bacterium]|nr:GNAT family N-acetyltransferase [Clostridia bacterium]